MTCREIDILAIGAGPSNLALAVALEENAPAEMAESTLLIERHPDAQWQRGVLLPWAESQVSFLKDLATLRNPRSHFTFLNFLHETGRLNEFVNLGTFTPYRVEISNYLQWVADSLGKVRVEYNQACGEVEVVRGSDGSLSRWRVTLTDGSTVVARDLVVGVGRDVHVPEVLGGLPADRIIHSTSYLDRIAQLSKEVPYRVVVVGGAQSAAELFRAVHDDLPNCAPTIVMRSVGFTNYQTSKFANELYYPSFIDEFFGAPPDCRQQILRETHHTNYGGLAPGLLEDLYRRMYLQRLSGRLRSRIVTMTDIVGARMVDGEVVLDLRDRRTNQVEQLRTDIVLLGTGFDRRMPALVRQLAAALGRTDLIVDRSYRVPMVEPATAGLYLQGVNEETHGISDSLLSVLADRSQQIVHDMLRRRALVPDRRPSGRLSDRLVAVATASSGPV